LTENVVRETTVNGKTVGRVIRRLRDERGIGLRELAGQAKIAPGYLSRLERRQQKNPSLDVLVRIARALDVPVSRLLGE
jgi:XRE family transcriptional regulator of biofilm formation